MFYVSVALIVRTIKSAYEWLHSVMTICNKKVGTPFQRCSKMFDNALEECKVIIVCYSIELLLIVYNSFLHVK